jgi:hypothetical protein
MFLIVASCISAQAPVTPIVDLRIKGLLGGVQDGKWVAPPAAAAALGDETSMLIYAPGRTGRVTAVAKRAPTEDICEDFVGIEFNVKATRGVAIGANSKWNPVPRTPKAVVITSPDVVNIVAAFLKTKGIARSHVRITQAFRIDIDGNGTDETVIAATYFRKPFGLDAFAGDYSVVLLKTGSGKNSSVHLLESYFFTKGTETEVPSRYEISSLADLNGDGKMEIVVYGEYYEGAAASAFEMGAGKPQPIKELQIGCGL